MPASIVAGTRVRLFGTFKVNSIGFDPQIVLFTSVFTPITIGALTTTVSYTLGVGANIVRSGLGSYYVEILLDAPGKLKLTWRSTFVGEEVIAEETVTVVARTVVV